MLKQLLLVAAAAASLAGCAADQAGNVAANRVNLNVNAAPAVNSNVNSNTMSNTSVFDDTPTAAAYRAKVVLGLQATSASNGQTARLPTLAANVAKSGADRRMEFRLPTGENVVYLEKAGTNFVILPNRRQYAELDRESLGFEVRSLMMPEQIVAQMKRVNGVERVGEETVNGRAAVKYRYGGVSPTGTNAGDVSTFSYFVIDKETGLPLHSETMSQAQNGSVQGYQGLRVVTDLSEIATDAPAELFEVPADYAKIDSGQVKAQVELIFNAVGLLLSNALKNANAGAANINANTNANFNR